MLRLLTAIPPIPRSMMASSDVVFWVMIGLLAVLALVAIVLWVVGNRRIAEGQAQVKKAGHQYEAPLRLQSDEQLQVHPRREEEIPLRR